MSLAARAGAPPGRTIRFPDGSVLELRPLGVKDGRLLAALAGQLSMQSSYRRFLSAGKGVRSHWVARLVGADQADLLVEGAFAVDQFGSSLVAVAESIRSSECRESAEFALVAADSWQNMGVGTLLARHLAVRARDSGIRFWEAVMIAENRAMAGVMESIGPLVERRDEDGLVITVHELIEHHRG